MAKKIKFPLEMKDGVKVRSLDELRENFDLERLISYFIDGRLVTWLKIRDYNNEANLINELKLTNERFKEILCEILEIVCEENNIDPYRMWKLSKLKPFIVDTKYNDYLINNTAFNQEELNSLLSKKNETIYLYKNNPDGDDFREFAIESNLKNVNFIGIGSNQKVKIYKEIRENRNIIEQRLDENNVVLQNVNLIVKPKSIIGELLVNSAELYFKLIDDILKKNNYVNNKNNIR